MAKLILHKIPDMDAIKERRMQEYFALSPDERLQKDFQLKKLSLLFNNSSIKGPTSKDINIQ